MGQSNRVVILGVFVADTAYRAERMPKMGETILGKSFQLGPGGKGSNQAVAAARLGADVSFITRLGRDAFADMAFATWKEAGVTPAVVQTDNSYTGAAYIFKLPVETIGTRFGAVPDSLPAPQLPELSTAILLTMLPSAFTFTLLGGIESLLSAKVADSMTGRRHRSNMELVAQGLANIASALFGGISVTGTIARTATNIRAGAKSPLAGILHAAFLLIFMLVAAPLAGFIPLAALAGVLVVVSWTMAEKRGFALLLRHWRSAAVLLATFGLTLLESLTLGIVAGCVLAALFALGDRALKTLLP